MALTAMLTFIYGTDTFRSRQKLKELVVAWRTKHDPEGDNVVKIDGLTARPGDLAGVIRSRPFLGSDQRLVLIERFWSGKTDDPEAVATLLSSVPESTLVIFWDDLASDAAEKRKVLKDFIKDKKSKTVSVFAFNPLSGPSLTKWVRDEAMGLGTEISSQAIERLVTTVGGDEWRLRSELEKLSAFRSGEPIRPEDVDALVSGAVEEDIFGIMDALAAKDPAKASRMIRTQVESGLEEPYVIAMLLRQVRILTQVRSFRSQSPSSDRDEVGRALGIHPFVAQKAIASAPAFAPALLIKLLDTLFMADRGMKTGKVSPGHAVQMILAAVT